MQTLARHLGHSHGKDILGPLVPHTAWDVQATTKQRQWDMSKHPHPNGTHKRGAKPANHAAVSESGWVCVGFRPLLSWDPYPLPRQNRNKRLNASSFFPMVHCCGTPCSSGTTSTCNLFNHIAPTWHPIYQQCLAGVCGTTSPTPQPAAEQAQQNDRCLIFLLVSLDTPPNGSSVVPTTLFVLMTSKQGMGRLSSGAHRARCEKYPIGGTLMHRARRASFVTRALPVDCCW